MEIPRMVNVNPSQDMCLIVDFEGGIVKKYDVKKLFSKFPIFKELLKNNLFELAQIDVGGMGIVWNKDIDLSYYEIWNEGESIEEK